MPGNNGSLHLVPNVTSAPPNVSLPMSEADRNAARIREVYYAAYDVMTGVRIAATLGGFFGIMVILVVYKSKSKTEKALEDPNVQAAALAEAEEEERQIAAVMEQTAYEQLNSAQHLVASTAAYSNDRKSRHSLDTYTTGGGGVPIAQYVHQSRRFSCMGGESGVLYSLNETPIVSTALSPQFAKLTNTTRTAGRQHMLHQHHYRHHEPFNTKADCQFSQRNSHPKFNGNNMCLLEETEYQRLSSLEQVNQMTKSIRRQSTPAAVITTNASEQCCGNIDIRVTQPTPGGSPLGSERYLENANKVHLAPLASISSYNSSTCDNPDTEWSSLRKPVGESLNHRDRTNATSSHWCSAVSDSGRRPLPSTDNDNTETMTDSVFREMEDCVCLDPNDTDDEIDDAFSTDSDDCSKDWSTTIGLSDSPNL